MCTAMAAEACGVGEKNRLHGGTWEPEGGPAFIPVSNSVAISRLPQQPSQRIANRSYEEYAYVKNYFFVSLFGKCNRIKRFLGRLLWVDLIKWVSNVCPSVHTSVHPQKVSSISVKFGM